MTIKELLLKLEILCQYAYLIESFSFLVMKRLNIINFMVVGLEDIVIAFRGLFVMHRTKNDNKVEDIV